MYFDSWFKLLEQAKDMYDEQDDKNDDDEDAKPTKLINICLYLTATFPTLAGALHFTLTMSFTKHEILKAIKALSTHYHPVIGLTNQSSDSKTIFSICSI